jgi:hypothetical protein
VNQIKLCAIGESGRVTGEKCCQPYAALSYVVGEGIEEKTSGENVARQRNVSILSRANNMLQSEPLSESL